MPFEFPVDTAPLSYSALPGSNVGLSFHNVQRKRLKKFAEAALEQASEARQTLISQGEPDTSLPAVQATRAAFNELRVRLPLLAQYYTYTQSHGSGGDEAIWLALKSRVLAWVDTHIPSGKPIDETNFEALLRIIKTRWSLFTVSEQQRLSAWMLALVNAKLAWTFTPAVGEGSLLYSNHYTHHYKILALAYDALGQTSNAATILSQAASFALQNFPFGNPAILVAPSPQSFNDAVHHLPRPATEAGMSFDFLKRDALHYQQYTLEPWLELALASPSLMAVIEPGITFLFQRIIAPPNPRLYEFTGSSVPFDAQRWNQSHPVYLQPNALYRPDSAARVFLSYLRFKQLHEPSFEIDARMASIVMRSLHLPSVWPYYFRTVFAGLYG